MAGVHAGVSQPKVETLDFRIELPVCPSVSGSGMPMGPPRDWRCVYGPLSAI